MMDEIKGTENSFSAVSLSGDTAKKITNTDMLFMNFEIRKKILEIFKELQKSGSSDFSEVDFMCYLISPVAKKGKLKGTFKGAKAYYNFIERIELEFRICFRLKDLDQEYSLDDLVKMIAKRIENEKGNKMIVKARLDKKVGYRLEIFLTILLLIVFGLFPMSVASLISLVVYCLLITWCLRNRIHYKRHNKLLYSLITGKTYNSIN